MASRRQSLSDSSANQEQNKKLAPNEIFPDVHHKMSKKIAQLTKVIYHLNTKNEDFQIDKENLIQSHQSEIQQILRDFNTKIEKFKNSMESKQKEVTVL
jgi:hypothetical protein